MGQPVDARNDHFLEVLDVVDCMISAAVWSCVQLCIEHCHSSLEHIRYLGNGSLNTTN